MPGLITLSEGDTIAERVTLDPEDCWLLIGRVQRLAADLRAFPDARAATVARADRLAELMERVGRRPAAIVGHDVGTNGDRLAVSGLLTPKQLQILLHVSERTARRMCDLKIGGRRFIARETAEAMR